MHRKNGEKWNRIFNPSEGEESQKVPLKVMKTLGNPQKFFWE